MAKEKAKHDSLLCFLLAVIVVLIVVIGGGVYYFLVADNDEKIAENNSAIVENSNVVENNKTEENIINQEEIIGEYVYEVPQQIKDEFGHHYDGITIKLSEKNEFEYYHAEGFVLKGTYDIVGNNIICNATTEESEYIQKHAISDKYTFKYVNKILELIKYEKDFQREEESDVFEKIGSKYVKNITLSKNSSDNKYSEITKSLENEDVLLVTEATKNDSETYTLKGKIITVDTSKEQIAEYPPYKETGEYKQITVLASTKCKYSLDSYEYETDTVENVFSKKLYFAGGEGACFNFVFENGKCVSVVEVVTGH